MFSVLRQLVGIAGILLVSSVSWGVSEAGVPFAAPGAAGPRDSLGMRRAADPIHVFHARGPCEGSHLQLEIFHRDLRVWAPHPAHERVPVETCQVEDAGKLLNELRWRCEDPGLHNPWNVGLNVFDPRVTESCAVGELRGPDYRIDIHVSAPSRSTVVRSPDRMTTLRGSVRIDGLEGVAYDVLLALDRSGNSPRDKGRLDAQLRAAAQLIDSLRPRLGAVRIGLASYPNPHPQKGESRKGRLELPLTSDADLLQRALTRIEARGVAGSPAFVDGLEHGLNQLLLLSGGAERPAARRVLVLAGEGHAAPFVADTAPDPVLFMRLDDLAADVRKGGVRLHVLALGGYAEEPTPLVQDLVARSLGRFLRIPVVELDAPIFSSVSLPEPEEVQITSALTGTRHTARIDPAGHFAVEVPLEAGLNRLRLQARTSDDRHQERDWIVEYDASQYLELVLEAERNRLVRERRLQRKELDVQAESRPDVGAGPEP